MKSVYEKLFTNANNSVSHDELRNKIADRLNDISDIDDNLAGIEGEIDNLKAVIKNMESTEIETSLLNFKNRVERIRKKLY